MTLISIALILVGVLGLALQIRSEKKLIGISSLIMLMLLGALLATNSDSDGQKVIYGSLAIAAVNFVFSRIASFRKVIIRNIIPIISTIILFVLFRNTSFGFLEAEFSFYNKFIVLASIVALVGIELANVKFKLLSGLIKVEDEEGFIRSLLLFFVGASGFLASFQSGSIGIFAIAAIYFSSSYYRTEERSYAGYAWPGRSRRR